MPNRRYEPVNKQKVSLGEMAFGDVLLDVVAPFAVSLKIAAYIFYNFTQVAFAFNLTAVLIAVATLPMLLARKEEDFNPRRMMLVLLLFSLVLVHTLLQQGDSRALAGWLASGLIALPFFLHLELATREVISRILYLCGAWMLLKICIDFVPMLLLWSGSIGQDNPLFVLLLTGAAMTPMAGLGGLLRIFDASVVFFPLVLFVLKDWDWKYMLGAMCIVAFVIVVNFTVAIFASAFLIGCLYLLARRAHLLLALIASVMIVGMGAIMSTESWQKLSEDKGRSFDIKAAQYSGSMDILVESPWGRGMGNRDDRLQRDGDTFFENSYLYLIFAYGWLALFPLYLIVKFLARAVWTMTRIPSFFPAGATLLAILVSAGSNPYLFAGGIYVFIYTVARFHQDCLEEAANRIL